MAEASESGVWYQDQPESGRAGITSANRPPGSKKAANAKSVRDDWDDDEEEEEEEPVEGERQKDVNGDTKVTATGTGTEKDGTGPGPSPSGRTEQEAKEPKGEEESNKIWEEANKRAPMPELVVGRASTSQWSPPPPAALQPTLRILKRPSPNVGANNAGTGSSTPLSSSSGGPTPGSGSGGASPAPRGTLAEREAQYQEARNRIFGEKEKLGCTGGNNVGSSSAGGAGVVVVRDPLGPMSEPGTNAQDKTHGLDRPAKGFGESRRGKKR